MTKAEFVQNVLCSYLSNHKGDLSLTDYNASDHAKYFSKLIKRLEEEGVKFSEEDTTSKGNKRITDV